MRIHYLQHVPFETPSSIINYADDNGYEIKGTLLYKNESLPEHSDYDFLIILGGPMGVYDENLYPWLKKEKQFIKTAIEQNKKVLGICLGAQLIADVLEANVYKNKDKEIGVFPVTLSDYSLKNEFFADKLTNVINVINVIHWHGDTFDLPVVAKLLASSEACKHQAFLCNKNIFGLQFHLEMNQKSLLEIINNCRHELIADKYIQDEAKIIKLSDFCTMNKFLFHFLDKIILYS
ncbi:MAG: type 1 glutamine amidotransferase [bacterium]